MYLNQIYDTTFTIRMVSLIYPHLQPLLNLVHNNNVISPDLPAADAEFQQQAHNHNPKLLYLFFPLSQTETSLFHNSKTECYITLHLHIFNSMIPTKRDEYTLTITNFNINRTFRPKSSEPVASSCFKATLKNRTPQNVLEGIGVRGMTEHAGLNAPGRM